MPSPDPTLDIAPGFDFDGSFVCPVCHEHGEPDDYEAHLATHNTLIEACVQSVQDLNAASPDDPLPDNPTVDASDEQLSHTGVTGSVSLVNRYWLTVS